MTRSFLPSGNQDPVITLTYFVQFLGCTPLLRNLPSPPLYKLLKDLLPTVPSKAKGRNTVPPLAKSIIRAVKEAVEKRNSLVHVGMAEIGEEWLESVFREARRLLYELDYHSGNEWAPKVAERVQPWGQEWYEKKIDV